MPNVDVLMFAEDPGAANFLTALPDKLRQMGLTAQIFAANHATSLFKTRGITTLNVDSDSTLASELIGDYKPRVIICGTAENKNSLGLRLLAEGRKRRLATFGVVDMAVNAANRFRGHSEDPLSFAPEFLLVPDLPTSNAFCDLGFATEKISIVGYPHFAFVRTKAEQLSSQNQLEMRRNEFARLKLPDKKTIIFIAEPMSTMAPELSKRNTNYTFTGGGATDFRTLIAFEELIDCLDSSGYKTNKDFNLVVRLHPKSSAEDFSPYASRIAAFSREGEPLDLLWFGDLMVGMTSMLLQESAWLGKNTLSILLEPSDKERLPAISNGLIESVSDCASLKTKLAQFFSSEWPGKEPTDFFEEGAAERMAKTIKQILAQSP